MLTQGQGIPAVRCPDRHRRRLHEVSAGRTEGARNSISLVQPPHHAEPEMTSPPCAFAHRLFPGLLLRRSKHSVGPSTPDRGRTCPPRTALPSRRLGCDRRPVEVRDVPVANRSPRSAYLTVGRGPQPALARAFSEPPLLHEGRDLLANGCAHCTKALSTRSTPHPPPVVPDPRGVLRGPAPAPHRKAAHIPWGRRP